MPLISPLMPVPHVAGIVCLILTCLCTQKFTVAYSLGFYLVLFRRLQCTFTIYF